MMRVVNLWKELNWYVWEDQSPRWRDRHEVVGVKQGVDSRDGVRHSAAPQIYNKQKRYRNDLTVNIHTVNHFNSVTYSLQY